MPYNSETETFYQAPATVVDSTPDGDTVQEGFDDRLTPAMAGLYADLNLLKADGMISVGIPATTTSRGIGRVGTLADMEPGAEVTNGPAFLDVKGGVVTTTPTAHAVPQADASGKLDGWVSLAGKADTDLSNVNLTKSNVVLQTKRYSTGAFAQGSTVMLYDNTIPQRTGGDQYMALTITPRKANSLLRIDVLFVCGITAQANATVALFDSTKSDALAAATGTIRNSGGPLILSLSHVVVSGGVSPITFTVRAGVNAGAALQFNGNGGGAFLGGVANSSIAITEYAA